MTPLVLALHQLHAMLYSLVSNINNDFYPRFYYTGETIFICLALLYSMNTKLWIQRQFVFAHIGFILCRGLIYYISFSMETQLSHLIMLLLLIFISLIITIFFFIPAYKKGYFNEY